MSLFISTNMYLANEFGKVFDLINYFPEEEIGVEVFPMFHQEGYQEIMEEYLPRLQKLPVSFHGPYYQTEHSEPKGSSAYEASMKLLNQTLFWARQMNCRYMVFHHNNCAFRPENKKKMLSVAGENLNEIASLAEACQIPIVVENAGVRVYDNMILDQQEFTDLCKEIQMPVLIDIGHAYANGWNLSQLIVDLKDQIISYHIHNNDGIHDNHNRIFDGTLDMKGFLEDYSLWTPGADLVIEYGAQCADDWDGIREDIKYLLPLLHKNK